MNFNEICTGLVGISFTVLGVTMRKQQKKDWRAFFFGGTTILIIVILSLVFGWKL
jgi:hypothetical protein